MNYRTRGIAMAELLWVSVVVVIILVIATVYFGRALDTASRARADSSAAGLEKASAALHALWHARAKPNPTFEFGGWRYRVGPGGWPVDAHPLSGATGASPSACGRLWQALISAPTSASVQGAIPLDVRVVDDTSGGCVFRWQSASAFFVKYDKNTGRARAVKR